MSKLKFVKLIDLLLFITLMALISSGVLIKFSLPPRSGRASIWGLTRHEWGDIHFYIALFFLFSMSTHLILHLKFIKNAISGKASREQNYRLAIGLLGFIALIVLLILPLLSPVAY